MKQVEDERSEVNCVFIEMQLQRPEVPTSPLVLPIIPIYSPKTSEVQGDNKEAWLLCQRMDRLEEASAVVIFQQQ